MRPAKWVAGAAVGDVNLLAVDLIDEDTGWAVGDIALMNGAVLRTTDGGRSWSAVSKTNEILAAVDFISAERGWVAGYAGRIQRTDDGGLTWRVQRADHEGEVLNSIFFLDDQRGSAVGGSGLLISTTDGGAAWNPSPTGRAEDFWSIKFLNRDRGYIVGEDGLILATTDGGVSWEPQQSGTNSALLGLALSNNEVVAVGEHGTVLRSGDFRTWSPVESGTTESLNSVGMSGRALWAVGSKGATVGSTDRGSSWQPAMSVNNRDLMAVSVAGPARAVAVGRRGTIQFLLPE